MLFILDNQTKTLRLHRLNQDGTLYFSLKTLQKAEHARSNPFAFTFSSKSTRHCVTFIRVKSTLVKYFTKKQPQQNRKLCQIHILRISKQLYIFKRFIQLMLQLLQNCYCIFLMRNIQHFFVVYSLMILSYFRLKISHTTTN